MKQEASSWPSDVGDDPIKRQQYQRDYEEREGICWDKANIKKPWKTVLGQDDAPQLLGKIWPAIEQVSGGRSDVSGSVLSILDGRFPRHSRCPRGQ